MVTDKLKLLFVSGGFPGKVHFMEEAIAALGYIDIDTVYRWNYEVSYYKDQRNLIEKVSEKIGYPIDLQGSHTRILDMVSSKKYDIIFIVKGNHIYPNLLGKIRKISPKTKVINWSHDDMFAKHNRSKFYAINLHQYDLVVTTKSYNLDKKELPQLGAKDILFQNNSCYLYPFLKSFTRPENFLYDVSFIGTAELERFNTLNYLAENDLSIKVFGSGWNKSSFKKHHPNLDIEARDLIGEDYFRAMLNTKISLSFLRKINRDLQTLRTVEIPFCGAFMIAEDSNEQKSMFAEDIEAVYFESDLDLLNKIKYYIKHDEEREKIAQKGMIKARSSFNMIDNAEQIIRYTLDLD